MKKTIIIAEAGVNHNGSIDMAKSLIDVAAKAGVDFVKFQTFKANKLVNKHAKKAEYQLRNTGNGDDSQLNMLKQLELTEHNHIELKEYAHAMGVKFLSTAFDEESADFLDQIGIPLFKIPSGEITNKPYLKHIAKFRKPIILSTGMADLFEIEQAMDVLIKEGVHKNKITVLHCNTEYPTPMIDVNLHAMNMIKKSLGVNIGYSDHTIGIEIPIAAVALGATVIEKHYTLDRNLPGPDHIASLEPNELEAMVKAIRNIELALSGDGVKSPSSSEIKNRVVARKSIVAATFIPKGTHFSENNLTTKRPGSGISPMRWEEALNQIAIRDFQPDELIEW